MPFKKRNSPMKLLISFLKKEAASLEPGATAIFGLDKMMAQVFRPHGVGEISAYSACWTLARRSSLGYNTRGTKPMKTVGKFSRSDDHTKSFALSKPYNTGSAPRQPESKPTGPVTMDTLANGLRAVTVMLTDIKLTVDGINAQIGRGDVTKK